MRQLMTDLNCFDGRCWEVSLPSFQQ